MKVIRDADRLTLRDSFGGGWFLGGLFLAIGVVVSGLALGLSGGGGTLGTSGRTYALLLGLAHLVAGAYMLLRHSHGVSTFDSGRSRLTVDRYSLLGRARREYALEEVDDVSVHMDLDGQGQTTYQLQLQLHTGEVVPLSRRQAQDARGCRAAAEAVREFLA